MSGSAFQTFLMSSRQLPLRFAPSLSCGQAVSLRSALGGNPAGLERGDVDDLGHVHDFGVSPLEPLSTHLIGIPSVVANELKAFVRNLLGDAGDKAPELLGCILSTENGLRMMYWASRSISSRLRGGTRWLR